jgi:hypothetical protein
MKSTIKQLAVLLVVMAVTATASFAQTSYAKGDNLLNVGLGFGGGFGLPIGVSFEHGVSDKISVGAYGAYASKSESLGFYGDYKYSYLLLAARGSYHFDFNVDKLDPYVGLILGYNVASVKVPASGIPASSGSAAIFGGHAGARYYLSEKLAVFGEVGYGIGTLNVGVAFKL